ncbi:MAG TPA: hypothetical protein PL001_06865, partial [Candidatus Kryptobacter bacterium]|nr:hypothetical protein [Candidatus Kryptobacter bacterium]
RTFRMMEQTMRSLGVRQDKMVLLAPIHPVRSALDRVRQAGNNWKKPEEKLSSSEETKVISILHDDLYLKKMLEPQSVLSLLADVYMNNGPGEVSVIPSKWADEVNRELWSHYSDSFQVRLKGVYEILLINADGQVENRKIFAKNVGPGWLGYHAYIAGKTLKTFVPGIVGLRRVPTLQVSLSELTI